MSEPRARLIVEGPLSELENELASELERTRGALVREMAKTELMRRAGNKLAEWIVCEVEDREPPGTARELIGVWRTLVPAEGAHLRTTTGEGSRG